ncbi:MAG TPA: methanol dehydrogenase [Acetobacteraceae bacterium]|jgi:uncharacterized protein|nr:methanol dehydrogenase [Acetobacteraceae bacterium]
MPRRFVFTVIAWICFTGVCLGQTLTFPALTGRVVDEAGLLSPADRAALTVSLAALEATTTDQLVVVTLKSLQGRTIEDYGYQLGRHWKIGQKDKDSGVLLIVAVSERKVRIEVGYGLEGTLTDAETKLIIENLILPRFKIGDFAGGIKAGTAAIIQALGGAASGTVPGPPQAQGRGGPDTNAPVWPGIVLGLAGVGLLVFCSLTPGGGVCRLILQILFLMALSGRSGSSREKPPFSGGGGSFGGGGSSGSW